MIDLNAEWRSIPGWPEYSVSEDGHVRRIMCGRGARVGKFRKVWRNSKNKYLCIDLWRDNRGYAIPIHRLVALAFLGGPPSKDHVVAHCDGSRDNNQPWNLRWATRKENAADTFLHGTHNRGARNGQAKLDEDRALLILEMAAKGHSQGDIARRFGVSRQVVGDIINGRRWRHVGSELRSKMVKEPRSRLSQGVEDGA
jgi:hypothetical protein